MAKVIAALVAAAAVVAAAGCGGNSLDTRRVEALLRVGITRAGVDVRSIQCPRKVDAKQGETFTCTATDRAGDGDVADVAIPCGTDKTIGPNDRPVMMPQKPLRRMC